MAEGVKPMFVYTIVEKTGMEKPAWVKIGIAFTNKDHSINVRLDALPLNGKLHIRERNPENE